MTQLREQLTVDGIRFFIPSMVSSLLFVQASKDYLIQFEEGYRGRLWVYRDLLTGKPSAIPEREMEVFIFVCTAGQQGLSYLGEDKPERIKKDRRLVVSIRGVVAVATSYIPPQFLEIISE